MPLYEATFLTKLTINDMAIANDGPQGPHLGRMGDMVYYILNGQNVGRLISRLTKPLTVAQVRHREVIKLVTPFLSNMLEFVNIGFSIEKVGTTKNAYNIALQLNINEIVTGVYPNLSINYTKVTLSKGKLKPAVLPSVELKPEGIQFHWYTYPQMPWEESTDQVMMLAYLPLQERAYYTLFGKNRLSGSDLLPIPADVLDQPAYTYISFVSTDRTQLSDSIYIGGLNLNP